MITEDQAKSLVKRLRSLPFDGDGDDATGRRKEVGIALTKACDHFEHAQDVVEHIVRANKFFPVPAEIWSAAQTIVAQGSDIGPADPTCRRCEGGRLDWVPAERGGVERCDCRKGGVA